MKVDTPGIYTLGLGNGELSYDNCVRINGRPLADIIMEYLPPNPIPDTIHYFGNVDVRITFHDYATCPRCGTLVRKDRLCQGEGGID